MFMESEFATVIDSVRRGEIVRIVDDIKLAESHSFGSGRYLMLAAERASPSVVKELLELSEAAPTLATTRDRLEQAGIVGAPFFDDQIDDVSERPVPESESFENANAAELVVAAARRLAAAAPPGDRDLFRGLIVRCTDWGGVVNCRRAYEAAVDLTRIAGLAPAAIVSRERRDVSEGKRSLSLFDDHFLTVSQRRIVDHRRSRMPATLLRNGPRVRMPTRHGNFFLQGYEDTLTGQLHLALWTGELRDPTLVRVHSECLTGDLLGSLRCDCGPQLDQALARLVQEGSGVLLYLRQEGRGIGLINKLRTYAIQDLGFDTVEANLRIGFDADLRDYSLAAQMLVDLGISTIRLLTNNPQKVVGLKKHGIRIEDRVPLVVEPCPENSAYLAVKETKMGHIFS